MRSTARAQYSPVGSVGYSGYPVGRLTGITPSWKYLPGSLKGLASSMPENRVVPISGVQEHQSKRCKLKTEENGDGTLINNARVKGSIIF
jgi:hypothetical protein